MASFDEVIPPGQAGKVTASVHTENYRGPVEKSIAVTTDDPTSANVQLRLKANIVGSVSVLPRPGLAFPAGPSWDFQGKLILRKDETEKGDLNVTGVTSSAPWLVTKVRKVQAKEPAAEGLPEALPGDFVLEVSVGEDAPKIQAAQMVKFKTGLPREPEVTIPVSVILQSPLRVTPSPLILHMPAEGAKDVSGTLSAVVRPGLGKETLKATASPEAFAVKVEPGESRSYRATVTWTPNGPDTPKEGNVVFHVGEEALTVLVRVSDPKSAFQRVPPTPAPQAATP